MTQASPSQDPPPAGLTPPAEPVVTAGGLA
jgi:hypothetical protein